MRRTLFMASGVHLRMRHRQLVAQYPQDSSGKPKEKTVPIDEIGMVVLEDPHITISQNLLSALMDENAVVVTCDAKHMPNGLLINMNGHSEHHEVFAAQFTASEPMRKNLWAQTIRAKISNQAALLEKLGRDAHKVRALVDKVQSGDKGNLEARAAAYYWQRLFDPQLEFVRDKDGTPPNHLLNYGYAILRATVARALVSSGLLPILGIHHRNRYNAYCLADDVMEPYRPFVDARVLEIIEEGAPEEALSPEMKRKLLEIQQIDVSIGEETSPILTAVTRSTASLAACYLGTQRKVLYPTWL